jgi:CRP/FNR family transcriptional regulator, cyclic AMP receptor protein
MRIIRHTGEFRHYCRYPLRNKILSMQVKDLQSIPLFMDMAEEDIKLLLPLMDEVHFHLNSVIFAQDQYADYFYILRRGEVEIRYKPYDGPFLKVVTIAEGDIFGWSSVLRHECYTSAAISVMDCYTYRIKGAALQKLCEKHPATGLILLEKLSQVISSRLNATQSEVINMLQDVMGTDPVDNGREKGDE